VSQMRMKGRIRQEAVTVNGREYDRYILDLGRVDGKHVRKSLQKRWLRD